MAEREYPFGWIDFSSEDSKLAAGIINALRERGAVDELGIGGIQSAFANIFFPGTSTIQTRAKYFFAVCYALRDVFETYDGKNFASQLYQVEKKYSEALYTLYKNAPEEDKKGIFGKRYFESNKSWVRRPPSEIYWSGIKQFGFIAFDEDKRAVSLGEFIRKIIDKVFVFCDSSAVKMPDKDSPFFPLLDRIIHGVFPESGAFHPKVWLLRFKDKKSGIFSYRTAILSRNLAFDRSWEELFQQAEEREKNECKDDYPQISPFWCMRKNQQVKIERLVPLIKYSSSTADYSRLKKLLTHYRLTLGQQRQQDIAEAFIDNDRFEAEFYRKLFLQLSPWKRKNKGI